MNRKLKTAWKWKMIKSNKTGLFLILGGIFFIILISFISSMAIKEVREVGLKNILSEYWEGES